MAIASWLEMGTQYLLMIPAIAYGSLTLFLLMECLTALVPDRDAMTHSATTASEQTAPTLTVLMPAHNEASGIEKTLTQLLPEVESPGQIVVVADNCDDATAEIARATGVTVLERQDTERRGKGYALDYGLRSLRAAPPEVVVMIDADCWVTPGTVRRIAQVTAHSGHPVQAVYRMEQPTEPSLRDRVSAFAVTVKNRVRAGGLSRWGVPVLLGGTGMAFPWSALQAVDLASGHIVEDMKLGIDLAIAGYRPQLALTSAVIAQLPDDETAATSQRTRWEHGHLQVLTTYVPKLIGQALRQQRLDLLMLALDLAIPPLALWSLLGIGLTLITGLFAGLGIAVLPFQIQLCADVLLLSTVLLCWGVWGRTVLSFSQLLAIPLYILWKIPLYLKVIIDPQKKWVRTKRST